MCRSLRMVPASFKKALEAVEAEFDAKALKDSPVVAILAPLVEICLASSGDFHRAFGYGRFGYESFADTNWTDEVRDSAPSLSAMIKEVAAELDLARASTAEDLYHLRREFMWRNHPDRRPDVSLEWSNARVAIANMLIDRALKERSCSRRSLG